MAYDFGFYNSLNGDRRYDANQMGSFLDGIVSDGVFPAYGNKLRVLGHSSLLMFGVDTGKAWFNRTWLINETSTYQNLQPADASLPRIDAICLYVDKGLRQNGFEAIRGAPSSTPSRPSVTSTSTRFRYLLGEVLIPAGAKTNPSANVKTLIGTSGAAPYSTQLLGNTVNMAIEDPPGSGLYRVS